MSDMTKCLADLALLQTAGNVMIDVAISLRLAGDDQWQWKIDGWRNESYAGDPYSVGGVSYTMTMDTVTDHLGELVARRNQMRWTEDGGMSMCSSTLVTL